MQLFAKQFNPSPLRKKPHEIFFFLLITNAHGSQFTFHLCLFFLVSFLEYGFKNQPTEWGKMKMQEVTALAFSDPNTQVGAQNTKNF